MTKTSVFYRLLTLLAVISVFSPELYAQSRSRRNNAGDQPAAQPAAPAQPAYFTGDGGKGVSIAILAPQASGLAGNQSYLPALVQGEFVSNFSGFSAISVLDRQRLDDQYAELFSGYYDEKAQAGFDLGHLTPTTYIMGGTITKTATGYALQMQITKTAGKMTTASYSGTCTFEELDNLTGVRRASLDLLTKMGVKLTAQARTELTKAAEANRVNAQTALAQGIVAQRQGTEVAALSYYFQAAAFDPSLLEAANRGSVMNATISGGNIGDNVRNDIQWRRDWAARLTSTEEYFDNFFKTSSLPYTLFYSTAIKQGTINYQTETVTLSIDVNLRASGIWIRSVERALKAVYQGLEATKRKNDWGLANWPGTGVTNLRPFSNGNKTFAITAELLNERNQVIGRQNFNVKGNWNWERVIMQISNDDIQTVNFNVKADDITDKLTIRVAGVNGADAQTAARNGVLQIQALSGNEWSLYRSFSFSKGVLTKASRTSGIIPAAIWGEPVTAIGHGAFRDNSLSSVTIPNSVTSIGNVAFAYNRLTSVTIPNGVTIIGSEAFAYNQLTSVTIPNGVFFIGVGAFANNKLTSVTIPNSVTTISGRAFYENQLTSVTIPNSVTIIGSEAFDRNQLTSVTIGNSVTTIWDGAFLRNQLTRITIGANVIMPRRRPDSDEPFSNGFVSFYEQNDMKAGTYTLNSSWKWSYRKQ